jgi:diacylglycerol kinase (ATP)
MGWGGFFDTSFTNENLKVLKSWVIDILMADLYNFDLWEVNISLKDNGHFTQIKDGISHVLKDKEGGKDKNVIKKLNKMCCNYFSTGVESRIGFGFEKRRTKSQMLNKFFYGTESIKKFLFKTSPRINDYVKSIKCQNSANEKIIINPKNDFKSNPLSLIFQNIPSMVGICIHILWFYCNIFV